MAAIERTFDWKPRFDERSRNYRVSRLEGALPEYKTWLCKPRLDQGAEGACVGFSISHGISSKPRSNIQTNTSARNLYYLAQTLDEWEGEDYEGTSVLAGLKAAKQLELIERYEWCFGIEDIINTVSLQSPVVIGVNWYEGMMDVDANGFIHKTGLWVGGHAIEVIGVNNNKDKFKLRNSWGYWWGIRGNCLISFQDIESLIYEDGEVAVLKKPKL